MLLGFRRVLFRSPVFIRWDDLRPRVATSVPGVRPPSPPARDGGHDLPQAPARPPAPTGISADALSRRIDEFLSARGYRGDSGLTPVRPQSERSDRSQTPLTDRKST